MNARRDRALRPVAASAAVAVMGLMALTPSVAEAGQGSTDEVEVINTETVRVQVDATGRAGEKQLFEEISAVGKGSIDLRNPIETRGLRNLDGFGGFDTEDGNQVVRLDVEGGSQLRTVSDYDGDLPLAVHVEYSLDGEPVDPSDVVGRSGRLQVDYTVENTTGVEQEVTFDDGSGNPVTKTVEVPIPMVATLTTVVPASFSAVASPQAELAPDGKGGTELTFSMMLFPPLGSGSSKFGYSAQVADGVVPPASLTALPVDPLERPDLRAAASGYQTNAYGGHQLSVGAALIDSKLLLLRDGANDLVAGLIKLRDGAQRLEEGLAGKAAPGASRLADGADLLSQGALRLDDGANELSAGAGKLADGTGRLRSGATKLADGAGRLADGAGQAHTGSKQLSDGLGLISGGLGRLADAEAGLPAAAAGTAQLKAGVDLIISKLGTIEDQTTFIGGLHKLETGLGAIEGGLGNLHVGLQRLRGDGSAATPGLVAAKGGVDLVKGGLDASLGSTGSLSQLDGGLGLLGSWFCPRYTGDPHPSGLTCGQLAGNLQAGAATSRTRLTEASVGLGRVSTGLGTAIGALNDQLIPGAGALHAGAASAHTGAGTLKAGAIQLKGGMEQISGGLTRLSDGLTAAVNGVLQLSTGSQSAFTGSQALSDGLGRLDDGAGQLDAGAHLLAEGTVRLDDGAGRLSDGSVRLADGTGKVADGTGKVSDGSTQLADGLVAAADGSGKIAAGLVKAADGAPKIPDGAQRLSEQGMSMLLAGGDATAKRFGEMYAVMEAGAARADAEHMVVGAPDGAIGLAAYSYEIQGVDGEGGRNLARGLGGLAVLVAGLGGLALRRQL